MSLDLDVALEAARKGGEVVRQFRNEKVDVRYKQAVAAGEWLIPDDQTGLIKLAYRSG